MISSSTTYRMSGLFVWQNNKIMASINGEVIYHGDVKATSAKGFVAFGTDNFGLADFDNLLITSVI